MVVRTAWVTVFLTDLYCHASSLSVLRLVWARRFRPLGQGILRARWALQRMGWDYKIKWAWMIIPNGTNDKCFWKHDLTLNQAYILFKLRSSNHRNQIQNLPLTIPSFSWKFSLPSLAPTRSPCFCKYVSPKRDGLWWIFRIPMAKLIWISMRMNWWMN